MRFAIRRRPSVIVARSSRAPDQPRETSGVRSATSPTSAKASAAEPLHDRRGAARRGGVDPVGGDRAVVDVQVVALALRGAVGVAALEPQRDAGRVLAAVPLDELGRPVPQLGERGEPVARTIRRPGRPPRTARRPRTSRPGGRRRPPRRRRAGARRRHGARAAPGGDADERRQRVAVAVAVRLGDLAQRLARRALRRRPSRRAVRIVPPSTPVPQLVEARRRQRERDLVQHDVLQAGALEDAGELAGVGEADRARPSRAVVVGHAGRGGRAGRQPEQRHVLERPPHRGGHAAAGPRHAHELGGAALGIGHVVDHEGGQRGVEPAVLERQRLAVGQRRTPDPDGERARASPSPRRGRCRWPWRRAPPRRRPGRRARSRRRARACRRPRRPRRAAARSPAAVARATSVSNVAARSLQPAASNAL